MPRIQFSDVVPPEKRSIRNVAIPSNSHRSKITKTPEINQTENLPLKKTRIKVDEETFDVPTQNNYYYENKIPQT